MSKLRRLRGLLIDCISAGTLSAGNLNLTARPVMDREGGPRFLCDHNTSLLRLKTHIRPSQEPITTPDQVYFNFKKRPFGLRKENHTVARKLNRSQTSKRLGRGRGKENRTINRSFYLYTTLFLSRAPSIPHPPRFTVCAAIAPTLRNT